jgi:hypothetical protein
MRDLCVSKIAPPLQTWYSGRSTILQPDSQVIKRGFACRFGYSHTNVPRCKPRHW